MGRRKSRKRPQTVKKPSTAKVPTSFDCPFCNHEKTVECKMDKENSIGSVRCRVCGESYQMTTTYLSEPIDVYSEWIDQCEEANRGRE